MSTQISFEDPKIAFTIKIINEQEIISELLNSGKLGTAAKRIAILLLRLNVPNEETEVKTLKQKLTPNNYHTFTAPQIYQAYTDVSEFLNRTYFSDFHRAKPRYGSKGEL